MDVATTAPVIGVDRGPDAVDLDDAALYPALS